jgi:GNAT superfamily N-acetyltransferase
MTSLAFRKATAADMAFVVDSFIDSYRTSHAAGLIVMTDWRAVMVRQLALMFQRPGVEAVVAYHPEAESSDLYGWLAVEHGTPPLVLYVYVKQPYRRMGIAKALLEHVGISPEARFDYAAKTGVVTKLAPKMPNARWNPLRARFGTK